MERDRSPVAARGLQRERWKIRRSAGGSERCGRGPSALREKCEHVADGVSVRVPEGRGENSPAFQRREQSGNPGSPEGTIEGATGERGWDGSSAVPAGLELHRTKPGVETPGYCHLSLRDRILTRMSLP